MHCKNNKCQLRMSCERYVSGLNVLFQEPYKIFTPKFIKKVLVCEHFKKQIA